MSGTFTLTHFCALNVHFNKWLHLGDGMAMMAAQNVNLAWETWSLIDLMTSRVIRNSVLKGEGARLISLSHSNNKQRKANLECSIIYKMAVSCYTNTRPLEINNEDKSLFTRKPREPCLGFCPAKVKNASDQGIKCCIFDSMSNNGNVLKT